MSENLWTLTPYSKWNNKHNKSIVQTNSINELANYKQNEDYNKLMNNLIQNTSPDEIVKVAKKWKDFDYGAAFDNLTKSNKTKIKKIIKNVIDEWNEENFYKIIKRVGGIEKFKKILFQLEKKSPDLFNYLISKWPDVVVFING